MMAITMQDISGWFDNGKRKGHTHLIIVCDTFDHEDYPILAASDEEALKKYDEHNGKNLQTIMEVYDLREPKEPQLAEHRAMHLPKRVKGQ